MKNINHMYIDTEELENVIKKDLKNGKLSERAKELVFIMINKMIQRNNFKSYDEDTKGDMSIQAFEYINRYWVNYKEYRYELILDNVLNDNIIMEINDINGIQYDDEKNVIKIQNEESLPIIKKYLKNNNIDFTIKKIKNSIFAYFSTYIWNAFLHVIKKKKFMYKSGSSRYAGTSIYSLDKESSINGKDTNYDDILIQNDSDVFQQNIIETDIKREEDVIYDRNEIIDIIFKNSNDIEDIINLSYKFTEESPKNTKIIYNDPSLLYILMKNIC